MILFLRLDAVLKSSTIYKALVKCYAYYLLLTFICVILIVISEHVATKWLHANSISNSRWKVEDAFSQLGILKTTVLIGFIGPLAEELAFRLGLTSSRVKLSIALGTLAFLIVRPGLYVDNPIRYSAEIGLSITISILFYFYWLPQNLDSLFSTWRDQIILISSILFAAVHISNFTPIQYQVIFLYPIYILPQFFMGLILGWLRIEHGFWWAVLFHMLVNSIALGLAAL